MLDNNYSYNDPELPLCVSLCAKNLRYESCRMIQVGPYLHLDIGQVSYRSSIFMIRGQDLYRYV